MGLELCFGSSCRLVRTSDAVSLDAARSTRSRRAPRSIAGIEPRALRRRARRANLVARRSRAALDRRSDATLRRRAAIRRFIGADITGTRALTLSRKVVCRIDAMASRPMSADDKRRYRLSPTETLLPRRRLWAPTAAAVGEVVFTTGMTGYQEVLTGSVVLPARSSR